jgi:hypothetical protein
MFGTLRNRLILIAVLVVTALVYLIPRQITIRERRPDGVMRDTVVKRVPIKLGLDLQGGMHLALELDQSQKVSADPNADIQRPIQVLRKRTDEFGVSEPLVQQVGSDRIVVELAGITDPARAKSVVQKSAFLEFRIPRGPERSTKRFLRWIGPAQPWPRGPGGTGEAQRSGAAAGRRFRQGRSRHRLTGGVLLAIQRRSRGLRELPASMPSPRPPIPGGQPPALAADPGAVAAQRRLHLGGPDDCGGVNQYRLCTRSRSARSLRGESGRCHRCHRSAHQWSDRALRARPGRGPQVRNETARHVNDFMAIVLDRRVQEPPGHSEPDRPQRPDHPGQSLPAGSPGPR